MGRISIPTQSSSLHDSPYIALGSDGISYTFKTSEIDTSFLDNLKINPQDLIAKVPLVEIPDDFQRTFAWYPPITIPLISEDGSTELDIQDPGFLIYEPSDDDLEYDISLNIDWDDELQKNQLKK